MSTIAIDINCSECDILISQDTVWGDFYKKTVDFSVQESAIGYIQYFMKNPKLCNNIGLLTNKILGYTNAYTASYANYLAIEANMIENVHGIKFKIPYNSEDYIFRIYREHPENPQVAVLEFGYDLRIIYDEFGDKFFKYFNYGDNTELCFAGYGMINYGVAMWRTDVGVNNG